MRKEKEFLKFSKEEQKERLMKAYKCFCVESAIAYDNKMITTKREFINIVGKQVHNYGLVKQAIKEVETNHQLEINNLKLQANNAELHREICRLNDKIYQLNNEMQNLKRDEKKEERLTQIIQILSEVFRRQTHLPSATAAIAWSKEALTKPYLELNILESILDNIEKGYK